MNFAINQYTNADPSFPVKGAINVTIENWGDCDAVINDTMVIPPAKGIVVPNSTGKPYTQAFWTVKYNTFTDANIAAIKVYINQE